MTLGPDKLTFTVKSSQFESVGFSRGAIIVVIDIKLYLFALENLGLIKVYVLESLGFSTIFSRHDIMIKLDLAFGTLHIAVSDPITTHALGPKVQIGAGIPLKHDIDWYVGLASNLFESLDPFSNIADFFHHSIFLAFQ